MDEISTAEIRKRLKRMDKHYGQKAPAMVIAQMAVEPVLRWLGWDTSDFDEVEGDVPVPGGGVGYSISHGGLGFVVMIPPRAKDLLGDWNDRAVNFAQRNGLDWCVTTDGKSWTLVKALSPYRPIILSCNLATSPLEELDLLGKNAVKATLAKYDEAERQSARLVREELRRLLDDRDLLASVIAKRLPLLTLASVRSSLDEALAEVTINGQPLSAPRNTQERGEGEHSPDAGPEGETKSRLPDSDPNREAKRDKAIRIHAEIENMTGSALSRVKGYQRLFAAGDFSVAAYVSISSKKRKSGRDYYWWTPRAALDTLADGSGTTYLALGLTDSEDFILLPYENYAAVKGQLNASKLDSGDPGWHLYATVLDDGGFWLCRNDSVAEPLIRLDEFIVTLPATEPVSGEETVSGGPR